MFYRLVYPEDPDAIVREIEELDLGKRTALIYALNIGRMAPVLHKASLLEAFAVMEKAEKKLGKGKPKPGDIITQEDGEFAWQFLIDRHLIEEVLPLRPKKQTRYRCPHNGALVQYKDRGQLCAQCRRQFTKEGTLPEGDNGLEVMVGFVMNLDGEEKKKKKQKQQPKVETVDWPDEIDVVEK